MPSKSELEKFTLHEMEDFVLFDIKRMNGNSSDMARLPFPVIIHSGQTHFVEVPFSDIALFFEP